MMIDLGRFYDGSEQGGAHAWYRRIPGTHLGVKVFRPERRSAREVRDEYSITKYLQYSGITTVALAIGKVALRGRTGASRYMWAIWMEHIDGITVQTYMDEFIKSAPEEIRLARKCEREQWALAQDEFKPIVAQMDRHCLSIKNDYGIELCDGDNYSNFIITPEGAGVKCIDFSSESLDDDKMDEIKTLTMATQSITIPQNEHYRTLQNLGYIP